MHYIDIVCGRKGEEDRKTSLGDLGDRLLIVGVLPHGTLIQPRSVADADELIRWLTRWKENHEVGH